MHPTPCKSVCSVLYMEGKHRFQGRGSVLIFYCCCNQFLLTNRETTQIYYSLLSFCGQKPDTKIKVLAGFLLGGSREESVSLLIQAVGRIQFLWDLGPSFFFFFFLFLSPIPGFQAVHMSWLHPLPSSSNPSMMG